MAARFRGGQCHAGEWRGGGGSRGRRSGVGVGRSGLGWGGVSGSGSGEVLHASDDDTDVTPQGRKDFVPLGLKIPTSYMLTHPRIPHNEPQFVFLWLLQQDRLWPFPVIADKNSDCSMKEAQNELSVIEKQKND